MSAVPQSKNFTDCKVADLSLADWGRKEINIAETEMPGLMAIREEFAANAAAEGRAHRRLAAHDDPDRRADRNPQGAGRRGALGIVQHLLDPGSRRRRDRRRRHAGVRVQGRDRWTSTGNTLIAFSNGGDEKSGGYANMILDDGGDATLLLHLGARAEKDAALVAKPTNPKKKPLCIAAIRKRLAAQPGWYSKRLAAIKGVTEETTTGVHRLYQMHEGRRARRSRRSTSTIRSPSRSSTTCTAAANPWSTASSAPPT